MAEHSFGRRLRRVRRAMSRTTPTRIRYADRARGERLPDASHVLRGLR